MHNKSKLVWEWEGLISQIRDFRAQSSVQICDFRVQISIKFANSVQIRGFVWEFAWESGLIYEVRSHFGACWVHHVHGTGKSESMHGNSKLSRQSLAITIWGSWETRTVFGYIQQSFGRVRKPQRSIFARTWLRFVGICKQCSVKRFVVSFGMGLRL
jgi:hypothetical protein